MRLRNQQSTYYYHNLKYKKHSVECGAKKYE